MSLISQLYTNLTLQINHIPSRRFGLYECFLFLQGVYWS